jgi:NADPH:quinone reductase-like Zn-dependent oxidoreductase
MPMGFSNVGTVIEVGAGVEGFSVGDRVASNGRHAEIRAGFAHVRFGLEYAITNERDFPVPR